MKNFLSPEGHRTRVRLELDGDTLNAVIAQTPDLISVDILPNQNDPSTERQFADRMASQPLPFTVNVSVFAGYRARDADVGYLRAAYLAAFADFGYSWISKPEMDVIRHQIAHPLETLIANFRIGLSNEKTKAPDGLYRSRTPVPALFVRMMPYGVFLPIPGHSTAGGISDWIEAEKHRGSSARYDYQLLSPMPRRMELRMDWRTGRNNKGI